MEYYTVRAVGNLKIIDKLNLIVKTSEFARIFGIEFYQVFSRGSQVTFSPWPWSQWPSFSWTYVCVCVCVQYRVESMMLRIAKPLNYIAVSPGVQQRARMRAPEYIALNLEPESRLYTHPVVVLDFQSLYPSIMIAYNYCFSTCLGRLDQLPQCQLVNTKSYSSLIWMLFV